MVTPLTVAAALNPLYQLERVLSGVQLLVGQGNSIRQVARFLNLPEGTVRRTIINQERAPSQATIDRAYEALREKGTLIVDRRGDTLSLIPIAPGPAALENMQNLLPGKEVRVVLNVPEADAEFEKYARGYKTVGKFNIPFDSTIADVVSNAGIDPNGIAKVIHYSG